MAHPIPTLARRAALPLLLLWLAPRPVRAEEAVRYKFQDYHETGGRIGVRVHGAAVEKQLGPDLLFKADGVIDAIAGASPDGRPAPAGSDQVPLARLTERRKAWNVSLARQFPRLNVALGAGRSRESDYHSDGASLNLLADFNQKNTTVLAGAAGTEDDVRVFHQTAWERKRTRDFLVGITQLLSPHTAATLNVTRGRQRGYLADPYKLVQKETEILPGLSLPLTFPENRPDRRDKTVVLAALNHSVAELRGALDLSYRWYRDSYDSTAHTIDAAWFQHLAGERLILRPGFRVHSQSAASFYHYRLDGTAIAPAPGGPRPAGPFYSSDYRLSALQTFTYGLKAVWNLSPALQVDAAFERYDMRGTDRVTPQSAYARANLVTLGARYAF